MNTLGRFLAILALTLTFAASQVHGDTPLMGCCVCGDAPKCDNATINGCSSQIEHDPSCVFILGGRCQLDECIGGTRTPTTPPGTATATKTGAGTATRTASASATAASTATRTASATASALATNTPSASATVTAAATDTATAVATATDTTVPTTTESAVATGTETTVATETATASAAATDTATEGATATDTTTPETAETTETPTVESTVTATGTATGTTAAETATATASEATPTDTAEPTSSRTPSSTAAVTDTPSATPTATPICATTPRSDCRHPSPAHRWVLLLRDVADRKDHLVWKWRGLSAGLADFGDPLTTTSYTLCLYAGADSTRVMEAHAPAGGTCASRKCWVKRDGRRYKYVDHDRTPDGLARVVLRANPSRNRANVVVVGRGPNLAMPALPLDLPVRAQLVQSDGSLCWESIFSAPALKNTGRQFRDKND